MPRLSYSRKRSVEHVRSSDAELARAIDLVGDFTLTADRFATPFDALLRSIVFQSVSTKAATTIHARVLDVLRADETGRVLPDRALRCRKERLRAAGLSWAKVEAIRDLASKTRTGLVPGPEDIRELDDEAIIERVGQVRGIGRWTVEMLLIFGLGRPDVLPATDLGIRKGFGRIYLGGDMPAPREVLDYGERWKPYRSVASWYLWRATELPDDIIL